MATFALFGLPGVLLFCRPLVPAEVSLQGLAPAFVGLFAIPWVLQNLVSRTPIPIQRTQGGAAIPPDMVARGVGAGVAGGLLVAFLPIVNGSIGGLKAGQATAQRDDRLTFPGARARRFTVWVRCSSSLRQDCTLYGEEWQPRSASSTSHTDRPIIG